MRLGSLKEGGRDGTLIVVSRDLAAAVKATGIAPTLRHAPMENEDERWRTLCERAGNEQDLERRIELVREINRMLIEWLLEQKDQPESNSA